MDFDRLNTEEYHTFTDDCGVEISFSINDGELNLTSNTTFEFPDGVFDEFNLKEIIVKNNYTISI